MLSQVARLLARAPEPMTRTDILAALGTGTAPPANGRTGTAPAPLPAFHQAVPGRWQLGKNNMQISDILLL
ncbi:hypothetical protein [Streptomyces sp. CRB46]|uniref:hypothetical protein n=1 Tax=Streptomyces sp. CRB46 TaxID=2682613 RepID=UPI0018F7420D|nr:hypothetical protein [Streptomyces sp. CRB46]